MRFQGPEVKYLTLNSLDDVLELFTNQENEEEEQEEDEDEDEEEEDSHFGKDIECSSEESNISQ